MRALVDTSTWVDHLRKPVPQVIRLAEEGGLLSHPFVLGELSLGSFKGRPAFLRELRDLEQVAAVDHDDVLALVESYRLHGTGVGWVGCRLLTAAKLAGVELVTHDRAMKAAWAKVMS